MLFWPHLVLLDSTGNNTIKFFLYIAHDYETMYYKIELFPLQELNVRSEYHRNTQHLVTISWKIVQKDIFSTYLKWSYAPRRKFNKVKNKYPIVKLNFISPYLNLNAKIVRGILIANVNVLDIYCLSFIFLTTCAVDQWDNCIQMK